MLFVCLLWLDYWWFGLFSYFVVVVLLRLNCLVFGLVCLFAVCDLIGLLLWLWLLLLMVVW